MKQLTQLFFSFIICLLITRCATQPNNKSNDKLFIEKLSKYDNNRNGETDTLIHCLNQVDSLSRVYQDCRFIWLSNHIKANLFSRVSEYNITKEYYLKAQEAVKLRPDLDTLLAKSEIGIAQVYKNTGNYPDAIQSNLKALTIFEKYNLTSSINKAKANIANVYVLKGDFNQAKQSLKSIVKNNYVPENAIPYHSLANVYGELEQIDSALIIDNIMITNLSNNKYNLLLSPFYNNKAMCYLFLKKTDSALVYFKKSFEIDSIKNDKKNMGVNLVSLADIYTQENKQALALKTYQTADSIFKKHGIKREQQTCYLQLATFFKTKNDYKTAMLYSDSANTIAQQIDNLTLNTKVELLQIGYETNKKDALIKTQHQKIRAQQISVVIVSLLLLLGITTTYFVYKNRQAKQKLAQQAQINQAVIETELQERERIARDLHDSVGQKLAVVKMQLSIKGSDLQTTTHLLDDAIQDVRYVSHNLMPTDLSKGLVLAVEQLCEQINDVSTLLKAHFNKTEAVTQLELDKQHTLFVYRIVQELVNNAMKYADAKNIHINMDCDKKILMLHLTDDGKGFDINNLVQKNGIGIKGINERIKNLAGNIELTSEIGKGTQYKISIPV